MLLGSFLPVIHSLPSPISGSEMPSQQHNPDEDPQQQLWGAVGAVFGSWMNQRAKTYRKLHDIPEDACGERMLLTEGVLINFVWMFLLRRTIRILIVFGNAIRAGRWSLNFYLCSSITNLPWASCGLPGVGHGRECSGDGLRQHGQRLRNGSCLHPQSFERRQGVCRAMNPIYTLVLWFHLLHVSTCCILLLSKTF